MAENSWFKDNMDMNIYAKQVTTFATENGKTVEEQLALVDEKIRDRFPEHFGIKKPRKGSPVNGSTKRSAVSSVKMTAQQGVIADRLIEQKIYPNRKAYMEAYNEGQASAEENLESTGHARRKATF